MGGDEDEAASCQGRAMEASGAESQLRRLAAQEKTADGTGVPIQHRFF